MAGAHTYTARPVAVTATCYDGTQANDEGVCTSPDPAHLSGPHVHTRDGMMPIAEGDWLLTNANGDRFPCRADAFESLYEPAATEE